MEQLRSMLASIRSSLGAMTPTQKLLIGSLAVVAAMTLFIVSQYSSTPSRMAVMPGAPAEDQNSAVSHLTMMGIDARLDSSGNAVVPRSDLRTATSSLAESRLMPGDASLVFESLIGAQSWQNSRAMNQQHYMIALQNELSRTIAGFSGIRDATVIIDDPEPSGLGRAVRSSSASVAVTTTGGSGLNQSTVDAIAHLVASSRSGLSVGNVRVIDRATNTQWSAQDGQSARANAYLDHKIAYEQRVAQQLYTQLGYIPNVIISVTADVDITQVESQFNRYLPDKDGSLLGQVSNETKSSVTERGGGTAAEAGLRSNATADINTGGSVSGSPRLETVDNDTRFQHFAGTEQRRVVDPRGAPRYMAATISVPEEFVIELVRQARPPGAVTANGEAGNTQDDVLDPADIDARFAELQQDIVRGVFPHLRTAQTPEEPTTEFLARTVHVSMVPSGFAGSAFAPVEQAGVLGMSGGLVAFGGPLADTIVVGLLSVLALGMMFSLVRRSTKKLELPTAEEMVGMPPALETLSEVVGEVDESISAMSAIEVGEEDLARDQVLEQVTELLKQNPESSARLLQRWMTVENS